MGDEQSPAPGVLDRLSASRIIAVLTLPDASRAKPLAAALAGGGIRFVEIALRTPAALESLRACCEQPGLCVGAGTVISAGQVAQVQDAGAQFVVSPGFSADVVRRCQRENVPVVPGVATASEVMQAIDAGLEVVKVFPAEPLGGTAFLQALSGPFPAMRWIPTGGIGRDDVARYLRAPAVVAVGGSWMAPADLVAAGRFDEVRERASGAAELAAAAR